MDALLCLRQPVSQTRLSLPSCLEYMGNDDAFPSRLASPGMCAAYSPLGGGRTAIATPANEFVSQRLAGTFLPDAWKFALVLAGREATATALVSGALDVVSKRGDLHESERTKRC